MLNWARCSGKQCDVACCCCSSSVAQHSQRALSNNFNIKLGEVYRLLLMPSSLAEILGRDRLKIFLPISLAHFRLAQGLLLLKKNFNLFSIRHPQNHAYRIFLYHTVTKLVNVKTNKAVRLLGSGRVAKTSLPTCN